MDYDEWETTFPAEIKHGPLWQFDAYRLALFLFDLAWDDCEHLLRDRRGRVIAEELILGASSIAEAIEEGYGPGFGKEYAYRLRIAIGEARESQGSHACGRRLLPPDLVQHRLALLDDIIKRLVPSEQRQRHMAKCEAMGMQGCGWRGSESGTRPSPPAPPNLCQHYT